MCLERLLCGLCVLLFTQGCYHYHIAGDRVTVSTESRTQTEAAYLWGLVQPNDVVPSNCPSKVPLAEVTAHTNFGYVLVGTLTLGTVVLQQIEWRCAKLPTGETHVLGAARPHGKG